MFFLSTQYVRLHLDKVYSDCVTLSNMVLIFSFSFFFNILMRTVHMATSPSRDGQHASISGSGCVNKIVKLIYIIIILFFLGYKIIKLIFCLSCIVLPTCIPEPTRYLNRCLSGYPITTRFVIVSTRTLVNFVSCRVGLLGRVRNCQAYQQHWCSWNTKIQVFQLCQRYFDRVVVDIQKTRFCLKSANELYSGKFSF